MNTDTTLEQIRHRMCCGKIRFSDAWIAARAIKHMEEEGRDVTGLASYYCVFCNGTHCGNSPKKTGWLILQDLKRLLEYDFDAPCSIPGCIPRPIKKKKVAQRSSA